MRQVTVNMAESPIAWLAARGHLTSAQLGAIAAVSVPLTVVQDPAGKNNGTATWTYDVEDNALDFLAHHLAKGLGFGGSAHRQTDTSRTPSLSCLMPGLG